MTITRSGVPPVPCGLCGVRLAGGTPLRGLVPDSSVRNLDPLPDSVPAEL
ncbi:hypothetical protein OG267_35730 [Kitasatospora herbaricolor]|nr:hypothetical protein [Kitasatospora herbaricolor]